MRRLFVEPEVQQAADMPALAWKAPDEDALVAWLCHEKQFSEERVRSAIAKMAAAKGKANQNRMESFFKVRRDSATGPAHRALAIAVLRNFDCLSG